MGPTLPRIGPCGTLDGTKVRGRVGNGVPRDPGSRVFVNATSFFIVARVCIDGADIEDKIAIDDGYR